MRLRLATVGLSIALLSPTCLPIGPPLRDEYPYDLNAKCEIRLADYDGDGQMDSYSVRSEKCAKLSVNGCPGGRRYVHHVIITKGGSNLAVILKDVHWPCEDPIEATGWIDETGEFAVKYDGNWHRVPWTAPRGKGGG